MPPASRRKISEFAVGNSGFFPLSWSENPCGSAHESGRNRVDTVIPQQGPWLILWLDSALKDVLRQIPFRGIGDDGRDLLAGAEFAGQGDGGVHRGSGA